MYFIYILTCSDGSLYTGITNNLEKRMQVHRSGKGAKYVRARLPFVVSYTEQVENRSVASKRELEIKALSREEKLRLFEKTN